MSAHPHHHGADGHHHHDGEHRHHGQGGHHAHHAAVAALPSASLLRYSALERLAGAAGVAAVLWALVFWAMS